MSLISKMSKKKNPDLQCTQEEAKKGKDLEASKDPTREDRGAPQQDNPGGWGGPAMQQPGQQPVQMGVDWELWEKGHQDDQTGLHSIPV